MIKAESKIVDDENCTLEMMACGGIKDIETEGIAIIKNLLIKISEGTGADQTIVLAHFIKRLTEQFEGVEYEINRYRRK